QEQIQNVTDTCEALIPLIQQNYNIVIGHGNGPQVGNVLLQHEAGCKTFGVLGMPLDFCVAETQGSIGYLIEMGFYNAFLKHKIERQVITVLTQVLVSKDDPAFLKPTKPIGPYYTKENAAKYAADSGCLFKEDPKGNGWRKVVASPVPIQINHIEDVERLANDGDIVITVGGGGIPVIRENGAYHGVEAVIDKDLACALAAAEIKADEFYILTDIPKVYINFRKPDEKALDVITVKEAKQYIAEGHFAEGSMAPKVRAGIYFVENGGKECVITEAHELGKPNCGTRIVK
ncbi:MAG: carbamate kinase, partial [Bacteroidales bacterium]